MRQKGSSVLVILLGVLIIAAIAGSGYLYLSSTKNASSNSPVTFPSISPTPNPSPSPYPRDFISSNKSPSGKYTVNEEAIADTQYIVLNDASGNTISENIVEDNENEIGYNVKFQCQCGTRFKEWVDDASFKIKIINGGGEEYEYIVDATTGKVDPASFKKIK